MQATCVALWQRFRLPAITAKLAWFLTPKGVWCLWGFTRAIMLLNLIIGRHYCDPQFYQYAGDFAVGKFPFFNVQVEYPPFALIVILLPALPLLPFGGIAPRPELDPHPWHPDAVRYGAYGISFGILILLIDALTLILVMRVARRWTVGDAKGSISGFFYTGLLFATGAVLQKFELLVGTFCLLAVLALVRKREGVAWALLALATLTKGYPILLAPLFLIWSYLQGRLTWPVIRHILIGGGIVCAVIVGPIVLRTGLQPLLYSINYHADRGIELETVWSSLLMLVGWLGGWQPSYFYNPADLSADISSPLAPTLMATATPLLVGCAIWAYMAFWQRMEAGRARMPNLGKRLEQGTPILAMCLIHAMLVVMLIFLLTFRALGLHYLVGVLPLVAIMRLPGRYTFWWRATLTVGLVAGQFSVVVFEQLKMLAPGAELILLARNALLVTATIVLARAPLLLLWKEVLRQKYHDRSSNAVHQVAKPIPSSV